jgi:hypothetical protein
MNIVKCSYDGTAVQRCNLETREVESYRTRGFMALSCKHKMPPEDVQNRSIIFFMRQNSECKELVPEDSEQHQLLRGRLIGLRLKALTEPEFIDRWLGEVRARATPEALGFDRRPRDIAKSLLLPALMCKQEDELIEMIRMSSAKAREKANETFLGQTQHVIEEFWSSPGIISVLDIRDRLECILKDQGDIKDNEKLKTRYVTEAIASLCYETVRKTNNKPFIDQRVQANIVTFEVNRKKFSWNADLIKRGN